MNKVKYRALIFFVFQMTLVFGQASLKFVSSANQWQMYSPQFGTSQATEFQYSYRKDSILIGGNFYFEQIAAYPENPGWNGTNQFFREESGKVFILENGIDEIYYDFTLKVGDSIVNSLPNRKLILSKIDTIISEDGLRRKRFKFENYCSGNLRNEITWIEGIGDVGTRFSQFSNCIIVDPEPRFNCFTQNNKIVFSVSNCIDPDAYKNMLDGHIWQVDVSHASLPSVEARFFTFSNAKTTFNGLDYFQLLNAEKLNGNIGNWMPSNRYFREENKKFIEWRNNEEFVHFDFGLQAGDTIKLHGIQNVLRIDTVFLEDQKPRKRIFLECNHSGVEDITWVEGIGDIDKFLDSEFFCSVIDPSEKIKLRCYFQSNYVRLYEANWSSGCMIVGTKDENKNRSFTLFPNPTSQLVNLKFEKPITGKIIFRNQLGLESGSVLIQNQSEIQVKTGHFVPGIYFLSIYEQGGNVFSKKLIIE